MTIRRAALLIAYQGGTNPGKEDIDSIGMLADVNRYATFLQTPQGGGWLEHEIKKEIGSNAFMINSLLDIFCKDKDFLIIAFFGHGAYNEDMDDVYLQMTSNPKDCIPALTLRNRAEKSLILLDCCRAIPEEPILTVGLEHFASVSELYLDSAKCRAIYDSYIEKSSSGNTVIYGCSKCEKSFGSKLGGIYTQALIQKAYAWEKHTSILAKENTAYCLSVVEAHNAAAEMVTRKQSIQHPDIEKSRSGGYLPFAVAIYKKEKQK